MNRIFRASIIVVGGLLGTSSLGCGLVTIEPTPTHTTSHAQLARAPIAPGSPATAEDEWADTRDPLERELLRQQLPVYGSMADLEQAQKQLAAFKESRGRPAGDRIPAEVLLARLRDVLPGAPASQRSDVLALYREARLRASEIPPWAGEGDEIERREFRVLIGALSKLVDAARARSFDEIPSASKELEEAYDDYKARAKHGGTPRARALAAEAAEIRLRFEKDVQRWSEAIANLEKDAERNRLGDEQRRLEIDTGVLQSKLGLTSFETGCDKTSPDPPSRQRLAALCPKMKRLHAIIAKRYAIEQRYMQVVWPDAAKRGKR